MCAECFECVCGLGECVDDDMTFVGSAAAVADCFVAAVADVLAATEFFDMLDNSDIMLVVLDTAVRPSLDL